jgi:aquaporin Z
VGDLTRKQPAIATKLGAELLGTFILTFTAAGADIVDQLYPAGIGHVARYTAPGIAVMAMIWALSGISGAHINPAVSLAFFFRRAFSGSLVVPYIIVQLAGATIAALLLRTIFMGDIPLGITKPQQPFNDAQAFAIEIALTAILVFTILGTAEQKAVVGKNAALAVGGIVAMCGLAFSPLSGASMNPARSLGPMIASLDFTHALTYIFAPMIGAAIAAVLCRLIYGSVTVETRDSAHGQAA